MQRAYLPTMPDDSLPEVRRAMGGHFYGNICVTKLVACFNFDFI